MLSQMLRELPSKTEMPGLLVTISQTAQAAGIETDVFKPQPEIPKEFYAIKPISLKMQGTYHQFGTFISSVASLPRVVILTMHNVSLKPVGGSKNAPPGGQLMLEGTVQTYRYLGDEEPKGNGKSAKKKGGK
jgi:type IV pilus assembly protein PilO